MQDQTQTQGEGEGSTSKLHTTTLRIPFHTPSHAEIARRSLLVDKEQNAIFVQREMTTEGADLIVTYKATTVRLLRLATNTFLSSCDLVIRTMEEFAPDPEDRRVTDDEFDRIREESNAGSKEGGRGIELRGNGVGAGSGQEISS